MSLSTVVTQVTRIKDTLSLQCFHEMGRQCGSPGTACYTFNQEGTHINSAHISPDRISQMAIMKCEMVEKYPLIIWEKAEAQNILNVQF